MKRMQSKRDLGLAVLLVLGASCVVIAAGFTPGREPGFPCNAMQTSASAINLNGNAAMATYFASNGTNGQSWATAYKLENMVITPVVGNPGNSIRLTNTNRYLIIRNCIIDCSSVQNGRAAIEFSNASHVLMTLCRIISNRNAITLVNSNNNIFFKNNVTNTNANYAFSLTTSINNSIYMNAISNSATNSATCASIGNFWDNGTRGNYWSNYKVRYPLATNNSIVWNTPYTITGAASAQDTRPLVQSPFVVNAAPGVPNNPNDPAATTAVVVIVIVAGSILTFAALVSYRDRLPSKMQRIIPPKEAFSRAGSKVKDGLGTAGEKTKRGLKDAGWKIKEGSKTTGGKVKDGFGRAGYKIRTFFSDLAFKIRHH